MHRLAAATLAWTVCAGAVQAPDPAARARQRGQGFWSGLVRDCTVPAGESAFGLVVEATSLLGSPDPAWRDDVGYGVVASCVYTKRALGRDQRRALIDTLVANLRHGLGETGTDSVLLRSFSALDLSVLAALELDDHALDQDGYRKLLDAALGYLRAERDLRGLEPGVGWIHATAHTADLLKFLARDPRLTPADQARLLEGTWAKLTSPGTPVFTHAEDERLAAAVVSVVRRADFDAPGFQRWLERFPRLEGEVWSVSPPPPAALDAAQNARNLLRGLFVALLLPSLATGDTPPRPPTPAEDAAREAVRRTLQKIRRS